MEGVRKGRMAEARGRLKRIVLVGIDGRICKAPQPETIHPEAPSDDRTDAHPHPASASVSHVSSGAYGTATTHRIAAANGIATATVIASTQGVRPQVHGIAGAHEPVGSPPPVGSPQPMVSQQPMGSPHPIASLQPVGSRQPYCRPSPLGSLQPVGPTPMTVVDVQCL